MILIVICTIHISETIHFSLFRCIFEQQKALRNIQLHITYHLYKLPVTKILTKQYLKACNKLSQH